MAKRKLLEAVSRSWNLVRIPDCQFELEFYWGAGCLARRKDSGLLLPEFLRLQARFAGDIPVFRFFSSELLLSLLEARVAADGDERGPVVVARGT